MKRALRILAVLGFMSTAVEYIYQMGCSLFGNINACRMATAMHGANNDPYKP